MRRVRKIGENQGNVVYILCKCKISMKDEMYGINILFEELLSRKFASSAFKSRSSDSRLDICKNKQKLGFQNKNPNILILIIISS